MKRKLVLSLIICVILTSGCGNKVEDQAISSMPILDETVAVETEAEVEANEIKAQDFVAFFKDLFSYKESEYSEMNNPLEVTDEAYFTNLKTYKQLILSKLEKYLSQDLKAQIQTTQTKLDFDIPSTFAIGSYIADARAKVERVDIIGLKEIDGNLVYEISVIKTHEVSTLSDDINRRKKILREDNGKEINLQVKDINPKYVYSQSKQIKDAIKVESKYWVEVVKDEKDKFKIQSLKQNNNYNFSREQKLELGNSQCTERLPYYSEVKVGERATINKVMHCLFTRPVDSFVYYEKVFNGSRKLFEKVWDDFGIGHLISVPEQDYKDAFPLSINPYKDNIIKLKLDDKKIIINPSIYGTQLQPAFIVNVPIQVILSNGKVAYKDYKYYVSMENDKVESIKLYKIMDISKESYKTGEGIIEVVQEDNLTQVPITNGEETTEQEANEDEKDGTSEQAEESEEDNVEQSTTEGTEG